MSTKIQSKSTERRADEQMTDEQMLQACVDIRKPTNEQITSSSFIILMNSVTLTHVRRSI